MRIVATAVGAAALAILVGAAQARGWQVRIGDSDSSGSAVVVDRAGDVVADGTIDGAPAVVKLSGSDGTARWRRPIPVVADDPSFAAPGPLAVDPAGDVVVAGSLNVVRKPTDAAVIAKLSGGDGSVRWTYAVSGAGQSDVGTVALAIDGHGNVIALVSDASAHFRVVRLAATDGAEVWRVPLDGFAFGLAIDAAGRVLVGLDGPGGGPGVVKLDLSSGAEIWRTTVNGDRPVLVSADSGSDVVVAAVAFTRTSDRPQIVKLSGATGAQLWRRVLDRPGEWGDPGPFVLDGSGDVVAGANMKFLTKGIGGSGPSVGKTRPPIALVAKLAGTTGAIRWKHSIGRSTIEAIAIDAHGDTVVVGSREAPGTRKLQPIVIKIDGAHGRERWRDVLLGTDGRLGDASGVALADQYQPVVVGGIANGFSDATGGLAVFKLCGANGRPRDCR